MCEAYCKIPVKIRTCQLWLELNFIAFHPRSIKSRLFLHEKVARLIHKYIASQIMEKHGFISAASMVKNTNVNEFTWQKVEKQQIFYKMHI